MKTLNKNEMKKLRSLRNSLRQADFKYTRDMINKEIIELIGD
jgi:hypothetical protein